MIETTLCDCCDEVTHHIEFDPNDISFDGEHVHASLTHVEAMQLYLCLRERVLNLDGGLDNA